MTGVETSRGRIHRGTKRLSYDFYQFFFLQEKIEAGNGLRILPNHYGVELFCTRCTLRCTGANLSMYFIAAAASENKLFSVRSAYCEVSIRDCHARLRVKKYCVIEKQIGKKCKKVYSSKDLSKKNCCISQTCF